MTDTPGRPDILPPIPKPRGIPPELEFHIKAVQVLLAVYLLSLAAFWYGVMAGWSRSPIISVVAYLGLPAYVILVGESAYIQQKLFRAGLYGYRGWHVVVGAMFLNPCAFGWWIPLSVLWAVRRAR